MSLLPRQAVVIVHGIGEQRPLETLRSFVGSRPGQGLVPPDQPRFSSPDNLLGTFYERRIKVCWDQTAAVQDLPADPPPYQWRMANTDVFELYWAYRYRDSRLGHISAWALPKMRRSRRTLFTPRLLGPSAPWLRYAAVLLVALAILAWFAADRGVVREWVPALPTLLAVGLPIGVGVALLVVACWLAGQAGLLSFIRFGFLLMVSVFVGVLLAVVRDGLTWGEGITALTSSSAVTLAVGAILGGLVKSLGDAARYLDNSADNLTESEAIKQQAVTLLTALHAAVDEDTTRPAYDRVVVVGHSLGTVVAYDAIRNLWARRHQQLPFAEDEAAPGSAQVRAVERTGDELAADQASLAKRTAFREAQVALSHYLRNPVAQPGAEPPARWIVSDFVSLACPLAHADLLVASSREDLDRLKAERLLATCPPDRQRIASAAHRPYRFRRPARGSAPPLTYLHHAAPFAAVRWTNFYFAHDLVGGPLAGVLGPGVEDHELGRLRSFADMVRHYPHSSYWGFRDDFNAAGAEQTRAFLTDLVRRPPTLLLSLSARTPPRVVAALAEQLGAHSASGNALKVDVQLYLRATDGQRQPAWFPIRQAAVPDGNQLRHLQETVNGYGKVTLLLSHNILIGPPTRATDGPDSSAAEPGTEDEPKEQEDPEFEETEAELQQE